MEDKNPVFQLSMNPILACKPMYSSRREPKVVLLVGTVRLSFILDGIGASKFSSCQVVVNSTIGLVFLSILELVDYILFLSIKIATFHNCRAKNILKLLRFEWHSINGSNKTLFFQSSIIPSSKYQQLYNSLQKWPQRTFIGGVFFPNFQEVFSDVHKGYPCTSCVLCKDKSVQFTHAVKCKDTSLGKFLQSIEPDLSPLMHVFAENDEII